MKPQCLQNHNRSRPAFDFTPSFIVPSTPISLENTRRASQRTFPISSTLFSSTGASTFTPIRLLSISQIAREGSKKTNDNNNNNNNNNKNNNNSFLSQINSSFSGHLIWNIDQKNQRNSLVYCHAGLNDDGTTGSSKSDNPQEQEPLSGGGEGLHESSEHALDIESIDANPPALNHDWREFRAKLIMKEKQVTQSKASQTQKQQTSITSDDITTTDTVESKDSEFQTKLEGPATSRWAHESKVLEKGCLLLAAQDQFTNVFDGQNYFWQTVIFIVEHSDTAGTTGVILNRPARIKMSEAILDATAKQLPKPSEKATTGRSTSYADDIRTIFKDNAVYIGGPVGGDGLLFLHGRDDIQGATKVIDGVHIGGLEHAIELAKQGRFRADEARFFVGYSGWMPGQLQAELDKGVWYLAAGSCDIATNQCLQLPRPLWRQVLDAMGGKYALIAREFDEMDFMNNMQ